jgi:hypothetical protein
MSFSETSDKVQKILPVADCTEFEKFILKCCKAPEWELRKWLRKVLTRAGFNIIEDQYRSERCNKDKRLESVHNMLAIRPDDDGTIGRVCLASHTDVCRDHRLLESGPSEYAYWMKDKKDDGDAPKAPIKRVEPVVKVVEEGGSVRRVIQDKYCDFQVGGDDRLGVAINTYIALNTRIPLSIYFPTDEEIGLKSARACEIPELKQFDLIAEVDRGNHSDQLVIKIGGEILCSYDTAVRLLEIAYDLGMPRSPVTGAGTDVFALKSRGMIKECVNMTCGYHESFGAGANEYIDVAEAWNTMRYISEIVKSYYLNEK